MTLPNVPIDAATERKHRLLLAQTLNELVNFYNTIQSGSWTPTIRGSSTAGTYELGTNRSRYTRIGRRVWLDLVVTTAGSVTGGGTGTLQITGAPFQKAANTFPVGAIALDGGPDFTAGANLTLAFLTASATSTLYINETNDNAAANGLVITALASNDSLWGSICYETDDP